MWRWLGGKEDGLGIAEKNDGFCSKSSLGAARSTPTTAPGALLGMSAIQNRISVQAAKVYYQIKNAYELNVIKEGEPKELTFEGRLGISLDKIT